MKFKVPKDLKYTDTHEWVKVDENNVATIGISDFAISQLSDLVHIELPNKGESLAQDAPFGEVESVKTVSELISPVSGKIIDVNTELENALETLSKDPYEDGWLIKLKMTDPTELEGLKSSVEYTELLAAEHSDDEEEEEEEEEEKEEQKFEEEEE